VVEEAMAPRMTLVKDRFIALHMMYDRIAPAAFHVRISKHYSLNARHQPDKLAWRGKYNNPPSDFVL
jgi:hypothetical protein